MLEWSKPEFLLPGDNIFRHFFFLRPEIPDKTSSFSLPRRSDTHFSSHRYILCFSTILFFLVISPFTPTRNVIIIINAPFHLNVFELAVQTNHLRHWSASNRTFSHHSSPPGSIFTRIFLISCSRSSATMNSMA